MRVSYLYPSSQIFSDPGENLLGYHFSDVCERFWNLVKCFPDRRKFSVSRKIFSVPEIFECLGGLFWVKIGFFLSPVRVVGARSVFSGLDEKFLESWVLTVLHWPPM